jgi:nucleotide-binding universal stress UspA family protein
MRLRARPDSKRPGARENEPVDVFDRIVVGVEGTGWGYAALEQSLRLRPSGGLVDAVTALDIGSSAPAGFLAVEVGAQLEEESEVVRAEAERIMAGCSGCSARVIRGEATRVLRHACSETGATLIGLGGRHSSRFLGIMLGSTSTTLLHEPSCSVLVARPQWGQEWHPRRIVVGLDGSDPALKALAVAEDISGRLGSTIKVVMATGGKVLERDGGWTERVDTWEPGHPVVALLDRSLHADLVLVGSSGLHGVRALGSVSERVAHRASCSVLVVHEPVPMGIG